MIIQLPDNAHRISLRRVDGDGRASDVIGHLVASNDEQMVVLPEDRPAVWIPREEIRSVRKVPNRTVLPMSTPDALQRVLDVTWPGVRRARLGGWVLRQGRGATKRANSVLASGDPGLPWRDAVAEASTWMGVAPVLQVVSDDAIVAEALGDGYELVSPTVVMVAKLEDLTPAAMDGVVVGSRPDEGFVGLWPAGQVDEAVLEEATAARATYLSVPGVASGRVARAGEWAVISCVEVAASRRGEGLGRQITRACVDAAATMGVRFVALQVEADNEAARSLYAAESFVDHHSYYYLRPAGDR